jgi:hypothetical protein
MAALLLLLGAAPAALSWSLSMNAANRRVYLHVGNGAQAADLGTVNVVSVTVPFAQLGNGTPQAMTSNSTQSNSLQGDNYLTCPTPSTQLLIGASYQRRNNGDGPASATLRVSSPPSLTNASGDTIPISEVSWTVSAPGSGVPNVITVPANTYIENCHTFRFANTAVRAAGTYEATVTYTISSP